MPVDVLVARQPSHIRRQARHNDIPIIGAAGDVVNIGLISSLADPMQTSRDL